MKTFLLFASQFLAPLFFTQSAICSSPTFSDIAENADGSIRYMYQEDAIDYCKSLGQHLPTAREFAQLSTSLGAVGANTGMGPSYHIGVLNSDNSSDSFYFDSNGYRRPAGDLGQILFMSASVIRDYPLYVYVLDGYSGDLKYIGVNDNQAAVRCVGNL